MAQARDTKGRFTGTAKPKKKAAKVTVLRNGKPIECKTIGEFLETIAIMKRAEEIMTGLESKNLTRKTRKKT